MLSDILCHDLSSQRQTSALLPAAQVQPHDHESAEAEKGIAVSRDGGATLKNDPSMELSHTPSQSIGELQGRTKLNDVEKKKKKKMKKKNNDELANLFSSLA